MQEAASLALVDIDFGITDVPIGMGDGKVLPDMIAIVTEGHDELGILRILINDVRDGGSPPDPHQSLVGELGEISEA
jgi:hypothetical protein